MNSDVLKKENILLNVGKMSKEDALKKVAQLLFDSGYTNEHYVESIFEREEAVDTYIGNGVAIPHGTRRSEENINKSGIVILQSKEGIQYGDNTAYIIIGIAGINDEHLEILSNLATTLQDTENVERIVKANSKADIYNFILTE